jgi:hypothetical protein
MKELILFAAIVLAGCNTQTEQNDGALLNSVANNGIKHCQMIIDSIHRYTKEGKRFHITFDTLQ